MRQAANSLQQKRASMMETLEFVWRREAPVGIESTNGGFAVPEELL
jgi:hypothetical protein